MEKEEPMERIHLAVLTSSLTIGGAEQLLLALLSHIDSGRFRIRVLFLREPGPLGEEILRLGYPHQCRIIGSKFDIKGIRRLAGILRRDKTDLLLLVNHLNTLFYGTIAGRIAGVKAIVNWHNETFRRYPFHGATMLGRRLLHVGVDQVVAASNGHRKYLASVEKVPADKLTTIYNAVDPSRFESNLSRSEARFRLGIPPDAHVVSMIAVLRPDKAHDILLQAARIIVRRFPGTVFLMLGDGPRRPVLEHMASEFGLSNHVRFLGFQRQLGDILAAVDIHVLSTYPRQETLSVAVIEAMSAGIPQVCSRVGFMDEIVIPGRTGFLVNVGNPDDLAEKLLLLIEDSALREKMGREARNLVLQNLTVNRMAGEFEKLFKRLMG